MKCPNCGTENRDEVRFCRKCGHPLALPAAPAEVASQPLDPAGPPEAAPAYSASTVICPACGATAKIGARFCPRCGQVLSGQPQAEQPEAPAAVPPVPPSSATPSLATPSSAKASSAEAAPKVGQTRLQMGPLPEAGVGPDYVEPQQPVPPADAGTAVAGAATGPAPTASGEAAAAPVKRGPPRWLWWALGGAALLGVAAVAVALLLVFLNRGGLGAAPAPAVTATATAQAGEAGVAETPTATLAATVATVTEATSTPQPTALPAGTAAGLRVELDAMPDVPRVGQSFMLAALLVNDGEEQVRVDSYALQSDGAPQLVAKPVSSLSDLLGLVGAEDLPKLFVFDVTGTGRVELQVVARVEVTGTDGLQEVLSEPLTLEIRE